jgi:hypothetical protein
MHVLKNKYLEIMEMLTAEEKKYVSYKSLYNFIIHLDEIGDDIELNYCTQLIDEYLNDIKKDTNEIDRTTAYVYFNTYISPLANFYEKIGFVRMHPLKYYMLCTIPIDIIFGLLFLKFPYPILTVLFLIKYWVERSKHKDESRYFSLFY